jgi:transcriptional regulator with GAF, ATPase, and Fis domain
MADRFFALQNVGNIRINQWYEVLNSIRQISKSDETLKELDEFWKQPILRTRKAVPAIIEIIGIEFHKEALRYFPNLHDLEIRVSYLQRNELESNNYIEIRHPENVFSSKKEKFITSTHFQSTKFSKGDGTTAGTVWENNTGIFIPDIRTELKKPESHRKFKILRKDNDIKSIFCIPISYKELFFGAICISCNRPNIISDSNIYRNDFDFSFRPIINQLILAEIVKLVADIYVKEITPKLSPDPDNVKGA